ncbi:MAG: AI-2E family transporter, partial [Erysipelotrichaceae bacterium]|nr:AI-2E family transporter [Erysipelotrichaceae bacterium]
MFRVPKEYKKQADFANYIILMLAIVLIVILYMEKISTILAWIISILFPFILGIGMAFVFNIISNALLRLWNHFFPIKFTKRERLLANIVSILIFLFVVFTAVMMVVPQIFTSINALISNMPEIYENARKYLMKISSYIPALNNLVNNLDLNTITDSQVVNNIESLSNIVLGSSQFMDQVNGIISTTISWFTTFFLAFAFSVFVLLNKEQFLQDIRTIAKGFMPK